MTLGVTLRALCRRTRAALAMTLSRGERELLRDGLSARPVAASAVDREPSTRSGCGAGYALSGLGSIVPSIVGADFFRGRGYASHRVAYAPS